jgi:flagellar biosynthesis protein FlhA
MVQMSSQSSTLANRLKFANDSNAMVGIGVVVVLSIMLLPIPPGLLDLLLSINISVAIVILLTSIYTVKPLDFAVFPTLLLITTLFRIALNVATSRLILMHGHEGADAAGGVIMAFGSFVVGGNYVIGMVVFILLVIVNFIVITKGTERISEVSARFTLDGMPGKQMSIDADLNAGMIDDKEARRRRELVAQEADFYGTMDGASKFVRGDAIAGILILFVNIAGGLAVGVLQNGMPIMEALKNYTLLTIGDGLVSQIPAIVISTSAGLLVTHAAVELGMGKAFSSQFTSQPKPLAIAGGLVIVLALVPGFPAVPFLIVGSTLIFVARKLMKAPAKKKAEEAEAPSAAKAQAGATPEASDVPPPVDVLELEVGYGLIPLVDESQKGDLLARIKAIRQQLANEYGVIVPALHVRDNLQIKPSEYRLLLKGNVIAKGELALGHYLALSPGETTTRIEGAPTKDPAFGLPAIWIPESKYDEAVRAGYTVIDLSTVVATHLTELFKKHADELLSRQTVQKLLDNLAQQQPKLVEELTPALLSVGVIQKVLQSLIRERVSIRDLQSICETLADYAAATKDPDILTEYVRQALARTITRPYETEDGKLFVVTLQQGLEERIGRSIQKTDHGALLTLEPGFLNQLIQATSTEIKKAFNLGHHPVVLCSPMLRRHLKKLMERFLPEIVIISHNELTSPLEIQSIGMIKVAHAG